MGFWGVLYTMLVELDGIRGQPADTLTYFDKGPVWEEWEDECLPYEQNLASCLSGKLWKRGRRMLGNGVSCPLNIL